MKKRLLTAVLALALAMASMLMLASCDLGGLGGGSTECTSHEDENKDHKCDSCEKALSTCEDTDKNHKCDLCAKTLTACEDEDKDHKCDLCEKELSTCADTDKDGKCDICDEAVIPQHICKDTNKDHKCDSCSEPLSQCADADKDHKCDLCEKELTQCSDANKNHKCDICEKTLSQCTDTDTNGKCDICGKTLTPVHTCADTDGDVLCDTCGDFVDYAGDGSTLTPGALTDFIGAARSAGGSFDAPSTDFFEGEGEVFRMFLAFTQRPLSVEVFEDDTLMGHNASFEVHEGFVKNSKYIVPLTVTLKEGSLFQFISPNVAYKYESNGSTPTKTESFSIRYLPKSNEKPTFLGWSTDGNTNHITKNLTLSTDDFPCFLYMHFDAPIVIVSGIYDEFLTAAHARAIHYGDIYTIRLAASYGAVCENYSVSFNGFTGANGWHHYLNAFTLTVTAGEVGTESGPCKCYDLPGDESHSCIFCTQRASYCSDKNHNHQCDECLKTITECMDGDKNGKCDICEKGMIDPSGADGSSLTPNAPFSFGIALTDVDEPISTLPLLHGKSIYRFYLISSVAINNIRITEDYKDGGTFDFGEGYVKNGRYIVPVTYTPKAGQICDSIYVPVRYAKDNSPNVLSSFVLNLAPDCVAPNFLGVSTDNNIQNAKTSVTIKKTDVPWEGDFFYLYYFLDAPLCNGYFSCDGYNAYTHDVISYENGIYIIRAALNFVAVGTHSAGIRGFYGPSKDLHMYVDNMATIHVIPGERCEGICDDTLHSMYPDGLCDTCGNEVIACDHKDENNDHKCDTCTGVVSQCKDEDNNHKCDICNDVLSQCKDENNDHACDVCKVTLTKCLDDGKDGSCDICGEPYTEIEASKAMYLDLLATLQQANNATAEWRVAIAPELAPYLFSDLSLATDEWFVGAEILFIHRLAYEMNYRAVFVPLSKEGCITALKNGSADAAIGCFTAEDKDALGVLSSQTYTAIVDPTAVAPTELFVLVAANKENDLSMIDKAIDFIKAEGAYDLWLAAAEAYVKETAAEHIDELGYYADGKKIYEGDLCAHEDENGDHICDNCNFDGMFCEDSDYSGYCDSCYRPIAGADLLMNPYLIGYSTEPYGGFFENLGMIELKHGVATTLYLKFNCKVKDFSLHFPSGEAASAFYYSDLTGVVYMIEIPAFDHIFPQGGTEFTFGTDYGSNTATISYSCLPDPMPEYLGAMVNGALTFDTVSVKEGETATVQFAMNVEISPNYLSLDGSYVDILEWDSEFITDGNETYYLYTVTFSMQYISSDEFGLEVKYTYLGASSDGMSGLLPMFGLQVSVSRYVLLGATVNGNDVLNSMVQIPHSTSYEILLSVNQSADAIRLATDVGVLEGELISEQGFFVYRFTVTEFSMSYVYAPVLAVSGNTELLFGALSFEILEQIGGEGTGGGEGGGGMTEVRIPNIVEIYDGVNKIPVQEKDVFHIWADGKLSIQITFDIPVAESYIKWNDMIYTAEIAPGENSYYYTVAMPMSASKEEGTFKLCFYENEIWSEPYEFSYKKEAAAFYGIYTEPLVPDIDHPSTSLYLPEGQTATVYLAMTAIVDPMELSIAGINYPIEPLQNPWHEGGMFFTDGDGDPIHIWFYTVELPAEVLSSEYDTIKLAFLQFDPDPANHYDNIFATYSINIVPAV